MRISDWSSDVCSSDLTRLEKIDAELEEACDAEDEDKAEKLEQRRDQVVGELQEAEDALQGYAPEVREVAGAIVTIDRNGEAVMHRGLQIGSASSGERVW